MDIVLGPSLKLDNLSSFPFSSLPTFRQVDESFGDIVFSTTQFGEAADRLATQAAAEDVSASPNRPAASGKRMGGGGGGTRPGRRRSLRKDRHSKIRTAQGLRDRRMRLSLDVAPEFFDIQDMLGFDVASKTLRWLITAAKPAIQELVAASRPEKTTATDSRGSSKSCIESSTPEELESGDMISTVSDKGKPAVSAPTQHKADVAPKAKRARRRHPPPSSRRAAFPTATIARESRLKARARARERTEKKSLLQSSFDQLPAADVNEDRSSLEQLVAEVEEHCSQSPTGRSDELGVTIFDYNQSLMCPIDTTVDLFHEQWDTEIILQAWEA